MSRGVRASGRRSGLHWPTMLADVISLTAAAVAIALALHHPAPPPPHYTLVCGNVLHEAGGFNQQVWFPCSTTRP